MDSFKVDFEFGFDKYPELNLNALTHCSQISASAKGNNLFITTWKWF